MGMGDVMKTLMGEDKKPVPKLYLDSDGRVHRRLAWAEFQRGEPVPLPEPDALVVPIQEIGEYDEPVPSDPDDTPPWHEPTREL